MKQSSFGGNGHEICFCDLENGSLFPVLRSFMRWINQIYTINNESQWNLSHTCLSVYLTPTGLPAQMLSFPVLL